MVALAVLIFIGSFVVKFTQGETAPAPETEQAIVPVAARVQVLNGCGIPGAASRFSQFMKKSAKPEFIVDVIDERNFDSFKQEKTLLIARKQQDPVEANRFAAKLGIATDRVSFKALEGDFYDIDYSVVLGADFEALMAGKK